MQDESNESDSDADDDDDEVWRTRRAQIRHTAMKIAKSDAGSDKEAMARKELEVAIAEYRQHRTRCHSKPSRHHQVANIEGDISRDKACKILHDKSVKGHPLTDRQRKYMAARCGGYPQQQKRKK